jgi:hypothetical protein
MQEKNERRSNWGSVGNVPQLPSVQRVNVGDIIKTNRYKYYNWYIKKKYLSYQMNEPDPKYRNQCKWI